MPNPLYNFWSSITQRETPDPQMMLEEFCCIRFTMRSFFNNRYDKKNSKIVFDLSVMKQESERTRVTKALGMILSRIGVPQDRQPVIVSEILQVLQVAVPMLPIDVVILEQTFTCGFLAGPYLHRVSPPARVDDLKPATKASIQSLEKVRLDRLEEPESTLCTICCDGLAEGGDGDQDQLIARIPCSHLYHAHCIVKWLEINHLCPLCRYPMPIN